MITCNLFIYSIQRIIAIQKKKKIHLSKYPSPDSNWLEIDKFCLNNLHCSKLQGNETKANGDH